MEQNGGTYYLFVHIINILSNMYCISMYNTTKLQIKPNRLVMTIFNQLCVSQTHCIILLLNRNFQSDIYF